MPASHVASSLRVAASPNKGERSGATPFNVRAVAAVSELHAGEERAAGRATILPDLAPCPECCREMLDPASRHYRYPFTSCRHCGPRFSIVESVPYLRANTTMKRFRLCPACAAEDENPESRRFATPTNACPRCGPQLVLWDAAGGALARGEAALAGAVKQLRDGAIVAWKDVGGFQLLVDACQDEAVRLLRVRKKQRDKPLAVIFPDLAAVEAACHVSEREAALLTSSAAPIVLLARRVEWAVAPAVAPANARLGAMLPASPLHHLLRHDFGQPLAITSGNLAEEPICTDEQDARLRLRGVADFFLVHDRPIVRGLNDSVARVLLDRPQILRRARGYVPLPVSVVAKLPPVLALGAQLKSTIALGVGREVFLSAPGGDLETAQARAAFIRATVDLPRLFRMTPAVVACDLHPDYISTQFARAQPAPVVAVQHHEAHVLACRAEHALSVPVLGICWDGPGHGPDGTLWGGEFLRVDDQGAERLGRFRPFPLPGGNRAAHEPRRSALGVLHALLGDAAFSCDHLAPLRTLDPADRRVLAQMLARGTNAAPTSSAMRLIDAVAALAGVCQVTSFDGQAAMELEAAIEPGKQVPYPFALCRIGGLDEFDWGPMIEALIGDLQDGVSVGLVAARFHATLAGVIVAFAQRTGLADVVLTGSCFQNTWLAEQAALRLQAEGFIPHWPQQVPPDDSGLAFGQAIAVARFNPTPEPGAEPGVSLTETVSSGQARRN